MNYNTDIEYIPLKKTGDKTSFNDFTIKVSEKFKKAKDDKTLIADILNESCKTIVSEFHDISKIEIFSDHLFKEFDIKKSMINKIIKGIEKANNLDDTDEEEKHEMIPEVTRLENFIEDNYDIRFNVINNIYEFRRKKEKEFDTLNEYNILRRARKQHVYNITLSKIIETMKSDFVDKFNPIVDYFKNLKWDGEDHIKKLLEYIFIQGDDHEQERFNRHFKMMFVRAAAGALGINYNKRAIIFVGGQDAGKTYFCNWLCPPALKNYSTDNIDFSNKDAIIAMGSNFWIILDELAKISRAGMNIVKSTLSANKIKVRLPYDARDSLIQRRCSFIGSTNEPEFLFDTTGNVRWICFRLKGRGFNWDYKKDVNIDQVWAQGYYLLQNAFRYDMTKEDLKENEEMNRQFMKLDVEMELIMDIFSSCDEGDENAVFMTATDIIKEMIEIYKDSVFSISPTKIGMALSKIKFVKTAKWDTEKKQSRSGYFLKKN